MDVYSRKIMGWQVYDRESSELASDLLEATCQEEGIKKDQVTLHSDNGSPMKRATMLATMQRLGVVPSFNRPGVVILNSLKIANFHTNTVKHNTNRCLYKGTTHFPKKAFAYSYFKPPRQLDFNLIKS